MLGRGREGKGEGETGERGEGGREERGGRASRKCKWGLFLGFRRKAERGNHHHRRHETAAKKKSQNLIFIKKIKSLFDDDEWQASIGTADKIGNIEAFLATLEIFSA